MNVILPYVGMSEHTAPLVPAIQAPHRGKRITRIAEILNTQLSPQEQADEKFAALIDGIELLGATGAHVEIRLAGYVLTGDIAAIACALDTRAVLLSEGHYSIAGTAGAASVTVLAEIVVNGQVAA